MIVFIFFSKQNNNNKLRIKADINSTISSTSANGPTHIFTFFSFFFFITFIFLSHECRIKNFYALYLEVIYIYITKMSLSNQTQFHCIKTINWIIGLMHSKTILTYKKKLILIFALSWSSTVDISKTYKVQGIQVLPKARNSEFFTMDQLGSAACNQSCMNLFPPYLEVKFWTR